MTHIVNGLILLLGSSVVASIVAKTTFVATLSLVGARLARGRRAAVRHAILATSFVVLLVLPIASVLAPPVRIAVRSVAQERTVPSHLPEAIDATQPDEFSGDSGRVTPAIAWLAPSLPDLLPAAWFAGAAFFLLRMIIGLWQVHLLRRLGLPWCYGQSVVERLAVDAGIHRRIEVLLHESLPSPVTCGFVRPAILLPPDSRNWSEEDLNRAIVHELEHVRRGDWMGHCLARAVCAAYWFHPLVWIGSRQLALEAERSCDDAVLGRSEATAYADQLIELARRLSTARKSPALAMASRSDLSSRVSAVLDARQRRGRAGRPLLALACATAAIVVVTMAPLAIVAAQSPSGREAETPLKFEVAVVRPVTGLQSQPLIVDSSQVRLAGPMLTLLQIAFDTRIKRISAPDWTRNTQFGVQAKLPDGGSEEQVPQMLQTLLAERFKLAFHREMREETVYALKVDKDGLKLKAADPDPAVPEIGNYKLNADGQRIFYSPKMSFDRLVMGLASYVDMAPVSNETGLKGFYEVTLPAKPHPARGEAAQQGGQPPADPDGEISIFVELRKMGLVLEKRTGPVEYFIVDHLERAPADN